MKEMLSKVYEPGEVEKRWSERWRMEGQFTAEPSSKKPSFSMVIPPPNITGSLHMGHALNTTLQDILARFSRMRGRDVLWLPGTDHAGIATQNVVERRLRHEGLERCALGREEFLKRVWRWKEESGGAIVRQLKLLGCSCDWTREEFTMSPALSKAVRAAFVGLNRERYIYRDERLINWCPRCLTALSDIEVEHEESAGKLYYIRYPVTDGKSFLTVATTRPETMLGDTAVAVHPDDERYGGFAGKEVLLPLTSRRIPVVADEMVDRAFGTGVVKITPAHDFSDFDAGVRHNLKRIAVFDERAHVKADTPDILPDILKEVSDLHAHKAREKVIHLLKEKGFLTKAEDHALSIGRCYRCKTVVEPYLSPQWFVRTKPLAERAIKAVEAGETKIIPKTWEASYFDWMRNIKDWCISRQIWWGHRIPAWYCERCNAGKWTIIRGEKRFAADAKAIVGMEDVKKCPDCGSGDMSRDPDVLDTWFSSALWPFSTLGWPERKMELDRYYPTAVLVTGFDIIFFWVARMLMMGLHFMKDVPFRHVYIHALVRDAEGVKMSKSRGNVMDPLVMMEKYSTDALRFALASMAAQGRDIKLSENRIEGYRNFSNKLWNLARFTLPYAKDAAAGPLSTADEWMLARTSVCVKTVTDSIENYEFDSAARSVYQFLWHELCDWYVELIKPDLKGEKGEERKRGAAYVLVTVLKDTLKLLHPFMPFITEEVFGFLPGVSPGILKQKWPEPGPDYPESTEKMEIAMDVIRAVRNIRVEMNISVALDCILFSKDTSVREALAEGGPCIKNLANLRSLEVRVEGERPAGAAFAVTGKGAEVFVPLAGAIDVGAEFKRLSRELEKLKKEEDSIREKLSNAEFLEKAPSSVVEDARGRLATALEKKAKITAGLGKIKRLTK